MSEIIAVTAGKGGVGKSVAAANIAAGLNMIGKSVMLIDADAGNASLDMLFGVSSRVAYNIVDVLEGNCTIIKALIRPDEMDDFMLLPGSAIRSETSLIQSRIAKLLHVFDGKFDYVVVDAGNCPGPLSEEIIKASDQTVLVMTADEMTLRSSGKAIRRMKALKPEGCSVLLNRFRPDLVKDGSMPAPEEIVKKTELPLLGIVLDDDDILISPEKGEPVVQIRSLACRELLNTAKRLDHQEVPIVLKGKVK